MRINNQIEIETAEGIDVELIPAGFAVRTMAFSIDLLIRGVILIGVAIIISFIGDFGSGIFLLCLFFLEWLYPVVFEIYQGATPGKKMFQLKVVYDSGLPITLPGAMLRNLFRTIDFMPFAYLSGFTCILFSKKSKRIGDWLAGTMVVYQVEPTRYEAVGTTLVYKTHQKLTSTEQVSIIQFTERLKYLSQQRQVELANILQPLLFDKSQTRTPSEYAMDEKLEQDTANHLQTSEDKQAVERLKSLANQYLGQE